jgi:hypothetical protein
MKTPPIDPHVADVAPTEAALADYDKQHMITYMRVFDADQQGADWRDVCRIVLRIDPDTEADRARLGREPINRPDGTTYKIRYAPTAVQIPHRCEMTLCHRSGSHRSLTECAPPGRLAQDSELIVGASNFAGQEG